MQQILNIVVAPLIYNNKILLLKRNKPPFKDLWGMPGGKVDFGEHIEDALMREIFEETGLGVIPKSMLAVISEVFFDVQMNKNYWHCLIYLYEVSFNRTNVLEKSTEGELKWFEINTLPKEQIIPSDYAMIQQIVLKPTANVSLYKIRMINNNGTYAMEYFEK